MLYEHNRRKGGNTGYKCIGKMFDCYPGCTRVTAETAILNLNVESCSASAPLINTNKDDCQHGPCLHRDSFLIVKCKYI